MESDLVIDVRGDLIEGRYHGPFRLQPLIEMARTLAAVCRESGHAGVLVDLRDSHGDLDVLALYDHASEMARIWDPATRFAVVGRPDQLRPDRFWETATRNRGVPTFVTTDIEEARRWLGPRSPR